MYPTSFDAANKIWTGVEKPITIDRKKNFGEIILEALSNDSERVMQVSVNICVTFRNLIILLYYMNRSMV